MRNRMRSTETGQIKHFSKKVYLTISLMLFGLVSCSKAVKFQRELPEMIKYSKVEFVECPTDST